MSTQSTVDEASSRDKYLALVPSAVIFAASCMLIHFLLPSGKDMLTESYEPTKTLRFFYTFGHQVHKWGPMPGFVFAPIYAVLLAFDKMAGHLRHISSQYPFGFDNPVQSLGNMIFAARLTTLLLAVSGIYYLVRTLQKSLGDSVAPVLAALLSLSTSFVFLESVCDTKPDGVMIALLIFALANYSAIVLQGYTRARSVALAFFYVASFSCKELTIVTLMLPGLGLFAVALWELWKDRAQGLRSLRMLALSSASAIVFYLAINVVYAPHAWLERLDIVFGPLKDPAIWAGAHQTTTIYLYSSLLALAGSVGWFGILLLAVTAAASIFHADRRLVLLWLPFISHLLFTITAAGYMPAYFMLPLGPALCLPASFVICRFLRQARLDHLQLRVATALMVAVCTWIAFCATAVFRYSHMSSQFQTALDHVVPAASTVNRIELFDLKEDQRPAPRGITIEEEPLARIMTERLANRPQYLFIDDEQLAWTQEIKARPARAAMVKKQLGFDYSAFTGLESLGYVREGSIDPHLPIWVAPAVVADSNGLMSNHLEIYHLLTNSTLQSPP